MTLQTNYRLPMVARIALLTAFIAFGQGCSATNEQAEAVGTAVPGVSTAEYIGMIEQEGPAFSAVGYLTYVRDLDPTDLFTDATAPDASTARFTFSASANLVSRAQVGNVTQIVAVGTLTIYFNEPGGANFNDPDSFSSGQEIAVFEARFYNVLSVIAPNQGVSSGTADLVQQTSPLFVFNDQQLQFGAPQLIQRLTLSGGAMRSQVDPPVSTTEFAAAAVTP